MIKFCLRQEHTVIESKPDHFLDDLRLNNPWPELRGYRSFIFLSYFELMFYSFSVHIVSSKDFYISCNDVPFLNFFSSNVLLQNI